MGLRASFYVQLPLALSARASDTADTALANKGVAPSAVAMANTSAPANLVDHICIYICCTYVYVHMYIYIYI